VTSAAWLQATSTLVGQKHATWLRARGSSKENETCANTEHVFSLLEQGEFPMFDDSSHISVPLRELMSLFSEQFPDLRFGDIDNARLSQEAAKVVEAGQHTAELEEALDVARANLAETQQALLATGQRALAYARIYAENSPEVLSRLQAISLTNGSRQVSKNQDVETKPTRRRGRKDPNDEMPSLPGTVTDSAMPSMSLS
jgi:hypothetical protein